MWQHRAEPKQSKAKQLQLRLSPLTLPLSYTLPNKLASFLVVLLSRLSHIHSLIATQQVRERESGRDVASSSPLSPSSSRSLAAAFVELAVSVLVQSRCAQVVFSLSLFRLCVCSREDIARPAKEENTFAAWFYWFLN